MPARTSPQTLLGRPIALAVVALVGLAAPGTARADKGVLLAGRGDVALFVAAASEPGDRYAAGTGLGVGWRGEVSFGHLFSSGDPLEGFFVRDMFTAELAMGYLAGEHTHSDFYARAFAGLGARIGVAAGYAAYYALGRLTTGFDNAMDELGFGQAAGRGAWLAGLGATLAPFRLELSYGKGTREDHLFEADGFLRFTGRPEGAFISVRYQGLFGEETEEHDFTVGLGVGL